MGSRRLATGCLPGAKSAYDAATVGFENYGKFNFLEVLDAQHLLCRQVPIPQSIGRAHRAAADIDRVLGEPGANAPSQQIRNKREIDTNKLNVSKKHLIAIAVIVATGVVLEQRHSRRHNSQRRRGTATVTAATLKPKAHSDGEHHGKAVETPTITTKAMRTASTTRD